MPGLYVYSNDGKTQLWYTEGPINSGQYFEVVSTGLRTVTVIENEEHITQLYTYEGGNTFLGFTNTANSDEVAYGIGSKVPYGKEIYVVEGPAPVNYEHILLNDNKVQVDSAIRDGNGVRIDTNYAKKVNLTDGSVTKVGTDTVGGALKPMYLNNGVPTNGTQLYSKTITINGTAQNVIRSTNANIGNIFAPTSAGNSGQVVKSNGSGKAPTWVNQSAITSGMATKMQYRATIGNRTFSRVSTSSSDVSGYAYEYRMSLTGASTDHVPVVTFGMTDLNKNVWAPISNVKTANYLTIYARIDLGTSVTVSCGYVLN